MTSRCAATGSCRCAPGRSGCATSTGLKLHPTQKPEALLHRVLLATTAPGDIVLDPFLGTGTTAVVARRLHRHFIGMERHPVYAEAAIGRVRATRPVPPEGLSGAVSSARCRGCRSAAWWSAGYSRLEPNCSTGCGGSTRWWPRTVLWWRVPCVGRSTRWVPQCRSPGLQWLDFLALREGRASGAARRVAECRAGHRRMTFVHPAGSQLGLCRYRLIVGAFC